MADNQLTDLSVGMMIKDNDPRSTARPPYQISVINDTHVIANRSASDEVRIAKHRVFLDHKPRRSGWSVCYGR